jgi:hypothetical protein
MLCHQKPTDSAISSSCLLLYAVFVAGAVIVEMFLRRNAACVRVSRCPYAFHAEGQDQGLADIWNRCIEQVRGEWVYMPDQDDIALPGLYKVRERRVHV